MYVLSFSGEFKFNDLNWTYWGQVGKQLTLYLLDFFRKHKNMFTFSISSHHWGNAGGWNNSSWQAKDYLSYIVNIMAVDDQGARASVAVVLT